MSDLETGTATEQPADDIRSMLSDAFTQAEAPETAETPEADDKPARARDATGKFAKAEEAPEPVAQEVKPEIKEGEEQPAQIAASREPPTHWSQADKDKFKAQTPEVQAFVLDRFKAMEGDYTRKTQEVAHLKKEYGPVEDMFAPHRAAMQAKGFSPRSLIEAWANVEVKLAQGPDSAVDVIKGLVGGYNIPRDKLAAALGISAQAPAPQQTQDGQQPTAVENGQQVALPPAVEAELRALREQVGNFGQKFQTIEQREANAARAREIAEGEAVQNKVNQFKSAQDDKGNLQHPHFEEVESLMTTIAQGYVASKQAVPELKDLYEMAVHASPSVREKVLTAQKQQEEARRTEEAKAKAAAARKAGSSVNGAPGTGQAPSGRSAEALSLREQLEAAADEAA